MKRLSWVSLRILIALAVIVAGAGFLKTVTPVEAASPSPETLRTGDLGDAWRYVETIGTTGLPYYHSGGQGNHLNSPSGIAIDGGLFVLERAGRRLRSFTNLSLTDHTVIPSSSGVEGIFAWPEDVIRYGGYTWVIDSHHLVVLDAVGETIADWNRFARPDDLNWVNDQFNCANSLSIDADSGLLYVIQNCGDNPVLALRPDLSALPYPTLTLENAWSVGGDWKHHIQVADLDGEDGNEIYISGDYFGLMQCLEPTTLPGPWDCATFGGGSVHRGRGITYSPAYDASHIYVLDYVDNGWDQNGLRRCDFDGNCENVATNNDVQPLGGLPFDDPQDVAYAGAGVFYITDGYRQVIGRLEANPTPSSFSAVFGVDRVPYVTEPGYLNSPGSVIVDAQNNLYVTERAGRRIVSYDPAGNLRWAWGTPGVWMGAETEEMCEPQGTMSFDPAGNLYVADRCNGRVVILRSTDGSYLSSFRYFTEGGNLQGFDGPSAVAFSSGGRLFVADPNNHRVQEYRYVPYAGWSYVSTIGASFDGSLGPDQIAEPVGLAANGDNQIFISDQSYNRIQKCSRADAGATQWTCEHFVGATWVGDRGNYLLNNPQSIALDGQGRLFVADNNTNRIKVYDVADGSYLASVGTGDYGQGDYEFRNPYGVATDAAGNVYVADASNHRVQKFLPVAPTMEFLTQLGGNSQVSVLSGGYLYTANGNRIDIYDVATTPAEPQWVARTQAIPGEIKDMVVAGNYAYVISNFGNLVVFDIATPTHPAYVREVMTVGEEGIALALDDSGTNLYALTNNSSGVSRYSLTNPANPVYTGYHWMPGWNYDLAIHGTTAYVSVHNDGGQVWSFDITHLGENPSNIQILDTEDAAALTLDGNLLYIADARDGIYLWNTTTSTLTSHYVLPPGSRLRKAYPQEDLIFGMSDDSARIVALRVSGSVITPVGAMEVGDWRHNSDCLAVGLDAGGDPLLYLPANQGLMVYSADDEVVPISYNRVFTEQGVLGTGWQVQTLGNTLYVVDHGILRIYDVTDPSAPELIDSLIHESFPDSAYSPFVVRQVGAQRILYVLGWWNNAPNVIPTLETFDITDPRNIDPLGSIDLYGGNSQMAVGEVDGRVVVAVTEGGWREVMSGVDVWHPGHLALYNATNPGAISLISQVNDVFEGQVLDITLTDDFLFTTERPECWWEEDEHEECRGGGLTVFDIRGIFEAPPVPPFERRFEGWGDTQFLDVEGNVVYFTRINEGLWAMPFDSAIYPTEWPLQQLRRFDGDTIGVEVASVDGRTLAWVEHRSQMRVLDVTIPAQTTELAVQDLPFHSDLEIGQSLPLMWLSGGWQGMSGWWAAPTMDGRVTTGGIITSSVDEVTYNFSAETLRLWHTPVFQGNLPPAPSGKLGIERAFESRVFDPLTEQPVTLTGTYTLTVGYDPAELDAVSVDEGSLKLYYWSGSDWVEEPSSLDKTADTLTAHPNHFSQYWSVFGAEDTLPPTGTITINGGAIYATSPDVTLTLSATDATTSVVSMRFSEDDSTWTEAEPYVTSKSFTLTGMDGLKTVYVQFFDEAGNDSLSASDSIILDRQAPTDNSVTLNEGEFVNSTAVTLTPASTGAASMRFSEDNKFDSVAWVDYSAAAQDFTLSAGDGEKTVYAQYRDAAMNVATTVSDTVTLDTQAPTGNSVTLNEGEFVNSTAVTLTPASTGAASMRFSEDNKFDSVAWVDYSAAAQDFTLSAGDGEKTVYAQYRDAAGNVSVAVFDRVTLDTLAPTGMISINAGDEMTANLAVTLRIATVEDVTEMRFMETNGPWTGAWSTLAPTTAFNLTGADGLKTVYAQFRDRAGNLSTVEIADTIVLDTTAPVGTDSVLINSGALYTTQAAVWLTLTPTDVTSGVSEMRISNASDGAGGVWKPFSGGAAWTLSAGDGVKTVYVWYRDALGHESGPFSDTISLDSAAPAGSVSIADGAASTTTSTAALTLAYTGTETGLEMRLSNSVTALSGEAWQPFAASVASWDLGAGNGVKEVFAQFRDSAGNLSPVYSDTILFDSIAPVGSLYINGMGDLTNDADVNLFITFTEAGSGVVQMRAATSEAGLAIATYVAYENPADFTLSGGDGAKTVCVQLKDAAGNQSLALCDTITLDTTAPVGSLSINAGAAETDSLNVTLTLTATDATSGMGFMKVSNQADLSAVEWQPYAATLAWALEGTDGSKTVYVQYMDRAGNAGEVVSDTITYIYQDTFYVFLPLLTR